MPLVQGLFPQVSDPERQSYLRDLAAAMDARKNRVGEHLAEHPPSWAVRTLGPVPDHPLDRLDWQNRAADIGAYRAVRLRPPGRADRTRANWRQPGQRAAWHAAFIALGPVGGVDLLRSLPDGSLHHMRASYATETAWAPRHVGGELRHIRVSAGDASLAAIRAQAEERIAWQRGQRELAERHGELARSWAAMAGFYWEQEAELAQTMDIRREWSKPPSRPAAWPWPRTPNYAAATRTTASNRSGQPSAR